MLISNIVVIQKKKPAVRIGLDTGDFLIVGWVRDSDLKAGLSASEIGDAYGAGGLGLVGTGEGTGAARGTFTCKQPVPLIAEVGVERVIVGSVGAGAGMARFSSVPGTSNRLISFVPSKMRLMRASRLTRSIG